MRISLALVLTCGFWLGLGRIALAQAPTAPPAPPVAPLPVPVEAATPGAPAAAPIVQEIAPESLPVFGLEVDPEIVTLPGDIRAESAGKTGVKVRRVIPDTMADDLDFEPGDVIYKINNHCIKTFDDILDIMAAMTPAQPGRVDFVRGRSTMIKNFRPDQTYNKEMGIPLVASVTESRYAGRFDFAGAVCNVKDSKGGNLGSFTFLGPLLFDYHKAGGKETVTSLFILKFPKGKPGPVVF